MNTSVDELRAYLATVPSGSITDTRELQQHLYDCWDQFEGSGDQSMAAHKLGRMERVTWQPPRLEFDIERHGGTVMGSSRAEIQRWTVDLDHLKATWRTGGHVQLQPMAKRLDVRPLAEDVVAVILNHRDDPRITWYDDGRVRVRIGQILPADSAVKQTLAGRRRRFRKAVDELLESKGWVKVKENVYAKTS